MQDVGVLQKIKNRLHCRLNIYLRRYDIMKNIDLTKYGISGTTEIVYNPSYDLLFEEETNSALTGYEKGQVSELGAVNVMTGV